MDRLDAPMVGVDFVCVASYPNAIIVHDGREDVEIPRALIGNLTVRLGRARFAVERKLAKQWGWI